MCLKTLGETKFCIFCGGKCTHCSWANHSNNIDYIWVLCFIWEKILIHSIKSVADINFIYTSSTRTRFDSCSVFPPSMSVLVRWLQTEPLQCHALRLLFLCFIQPFLFVCLFVGIFCPIIYLVIIYACSDNVYISQKKKKDAELLTFQRLLLIL